MQKMLQFPIKELNKVHHAKICPSNPSRSIVKAKKPSSGKEGRVKKKTVNFHRNKCRQVKRRPNVTDQKVSPVLFSFHSRIARWWNFISTRWPDASLKPTDISRRYNRTIYISIKRVSVRGKTGSKWNESAPRTV